MEKTGPWRSICCVRSARLGRTDLMHSPFVVGSALLLWLESWSCNPSSWEVDTHQRYRGFPELYETVSNHFTTKPKENKKLFKPQIGGWLAGWPRLRS